MTTYPQNVIDRLTIIVGLKMTLAEQKEDIGWSMYALNKARKELGLATKSEDAYKYRKSVRLRRLERIGIQ